MTVTVTYEFDWDSIAGTSYRRQAGTHTRSTVVRARCGSGGARRRRTADAVRGGVTMAADAPADRPAAPLENEHRRSLYETIRADPGRCLTTVSEESGVALSTARHHLRVLEEENLIRSVKSGGKRRYLPVDEGDAELLTALAEPATRRVLEALATIGPARNGGLAEELDRDPSTVSHHLSKLEELGLVRRERDGRAVVNELTDVAAET